MPGWEFQPALTLTDIVTEAKEQIEPGQFPFASIQDGVFRAGRKYHCHWKNRRALMETMLGGILFATGQTTGIQRANLFESAITNWPPAIAVDCNIVPVTGPVESCDENDSTAGQPRIAEAVIHYEYREYDTGQDSADGSLFITEEWNPSAEFLTVPSGKLYWVGPPPAGEELKLDEMPGKILRKGGWIITHHLCGVIPEGLDDWAGKVNETDHSSPKYGLSFDAETLQAASPVRERIMTATGRAGWNITLPLAHQPHGWNKFYRAGSAVAEDIYDEFGVYRLYSRVPMGLMTPT